MEPTQSSGTTPSGLTRRQALAAGASLCGLAALGVTFAAAPAAQATAGIQTLRGGRVRVDLNVLTGLSRAGSGLAIGNVRGVPVGVVRTSSGFVALNLRCTHQQVTVTWTGGMWNCPAHGSQFAATGAVTRGPAGAPLASARVQRKGRFLYVG
jgi:Rieske Fe-S protein